MRPKFVFAILLVAISVIGAVVFLKSRLIAPSHEIATAPAPVATNVPLSAPTPVSTPAPAVVKKTMTPEEKQEAIDAETDRLYAWSMNNDPQSLSNILGDLISPEKEIRMAAIDAVKELGDTNAIPVLKSLAANTDDNKEAIALLEAADFLSVPPIDFKAPAVPKTPEQIQLDAQQAAARDARNQARQGSSQNSQTSAAGQSQSPAQP